MDDLVAWLRGVLDEDEQLARRANVVQDDPHWWVSEVTASGGELFTVRSNRDNRPIARVQRLEGGDFDPGLILDGASVAEHIARHDPAAVLADIEAKRAILDLHYAAGDQCAECSGAHGIDPVLAPCRTVRLLASAYRDRPGYRDEWRP